MIALEVLTSFFLEAGFLGIMLYGLRRVGPRLHFFATCMVALGTLLSASWILSANSWMQTPDGVAMQNGRLVVTDWLKVIVNPSWLYRLPHMLTAAYLTASFLVAGVGAFYLLRRKHTLFARKSVSIGMAFATILKRPPCPAADSDHIVGRRRSFETAASMAAEISSVEGSKSKIVSSGSVKLSAQVSQVWGVLYELDSPDRRGGSVIASGMPDASSNFLDGILAG